jgi:hypothetical protein
MSSTEARRSDYGCIALAMLIVIFTASASLGFSTRAHAQLGAVQERQDEVVTTIAVAAVVAGFGAYGWVANKFYDLGKSVGRSQALAESDSKKGGVGSGLYLDQRYEILLD